MGLYQTLGVARNASKDEIKKAFRNLARRLHPDVNQGDRTGEKKLRDAQTAYKVLSNDEERLKYDSFGGSAISNPGVKAEPARPLRTDDFPTFDQKMAPPTMNFNKASQDIGNDFARMFRDSERPPR